MKLEIQNLAWDTHKNAICSPHDIAKKKKCSFGVKGILSTTIEIFSWKTIEKRRQHVSTYLSSKIFATSAWVWMHSTSFSSFQQSNWSPTYILHLFHLEDTALLFLFLSASVKVHFLLCVDTFSFAQEPHVVYCF